MKKPPARSSRSTVTARLAAVSVSTSAAWSVTPAACSSHSDPDVTPSLGVLVGTGMAALMNQVLDAACKDGDLTRAGVLKAFEGLKDADTDGLVVPIRGFESGKSPSLQSFILQPADQPGGAKQLQDATEGEFAAKVGG